MKADRYRPIIWPLFAGFVTFFLSGKSFEGPDWPVVATAAVSTLAAIYGSDPRSPGSPAVRIGLIVAGLLATCDLILTQFAVDCDLMALFMLLIFSVPVVRAEIRRQSQAKAREGSITSSSPPQSNE
jgi:hypothetical protein